MTPTIKNLLVKLGKALPVITGLGLAVLLGYTAYQINGALNLQPGTPTSTPPPSISFDKKTIQYIQSLRAVPGDTGVSSVGKANPFGY